ncbi:MAG: tRNA threonylcarbamoyladenosine dehydratase [Bacteroidetes bacterium]|nr:MAG: tRNA threonylcarbamoyladenosine dehydratase [Bacteroidota bacterium]PIE88548.1 MAG: tRNA threonylcarbamoyladenosine dehydratase [Bacteroidota bacterium]
MEQWTDRTTLLLGSEKMRKLQEAHILVVGLGGVGAYAVESLTRAGIGKFTIVDGDTVSTTNLNRQLPALNSTLAQSKADLLKKRMLDINPEVEVIALHEYLKDDRIIEVLEQAPYDYVVDAIDTLAPKVFLTFHALKRHLPIVCAMGAGGRLDPSKVTISDVKDSYNDKLAFYFRKRLHRLGIREGFKVVFSSEKPNEEALQQVDDAKNQKSIRGTISYMPALFGLFCASVVIQGLTMPEKI